MWKVRFNPKVLNEDLPALDSAVRRMIMKAIFKKLVAAPESNGKPLKGELFGYWKLRVGDYRIIYRMIDNILEVLIFQIGPRRDSEAYHAAISRLEKPA